MSKFLLTFLMLSCRAIKLPSFTNLKSGWPYLCKHFSVSPPWAYRQDCLVSYRFNRRFVQTHFVIESHSDPTDRFWCCNLLVISLLPATVRKRCNFAKKMALLFAEARVESAFAMFAFGLTVSSSPGLMRFWDFSLWMKNERRKTKLTDHDSEASDWQFTLPSL